jgi:hypothetical protein
VTPFAPRFATTLTDGLYLLRSPVLSVAAPVAALLVGLLYGWLHSGPTFTRSIMALSLLLAIGLLSVQLGWCTLLGYVLGDAFLSDQSVSYYKEYAFIERLAREGGSTFISYLILAILLVGIPSVALGTRVSVSRALRRFPAAPWIAAAIAAVFCGYLAYAWSHTSAALIRPVFTWLGRQPDTADIFALQGRGTVLAITAALVVLVRVLIEDRLTNDRVNRVAQRLLVQMPVAVARSRANHSIAAPMVRAVLLAICLTLVLAGVIASVFEGLVVAMLFVGLYLLRNVLTRIPGWHFVERVPPVVRLLIALAISYPLMASYLEGSYGGGSSLRPVLVTAFIGIAIATLASATSAVDRAPRPRTTMQ